MEEVITGKASVVASIFFNRLVGRKFLTAHSILLSIIKNLLFTYLDSCEINCDFRLIIKFYLQEKRKSKFSRIDFRESRGKGIERKLVGKRKKKIIIENGGRLKIATFLSDYCQIFRRHPFPRQTQNTETVGTHRNWD